jgi:HeH/LEM domain
MASKPSSKTPPAPEPEAASESAPEPTGSDEIWPGTPDYPNDAGYTNHQAGQIAGYYGAEGEGEGDGLAVAWDVTASGPYTLAVDGVSTTQLTETSTVEEIETALNETSGPVGLDVAGDPTAFSVSTDTPATLTASGDATVTVTESAPAATESEEEDEGGDTIDIDLLTVDELKAELDARGIEYASTDRKADLQDKLLASESG